MTTTTLTRERMDQLQDRRTGRCSTAIGVASNDSVETVADAYDRAAVRVDAVESRCRYRRETTAGRFRGQPDLGQP